MRSRPASDWSNPVQSSANMEPESAVSQLYRDATDVCAFTPGPWRVAPESVGRYKVVAANGGKVVGEACGYNVQADENARLIAAAPDLLVALERIVQLNDKLPEEHPSRLSHGEYAQACAAIMKARGQ